MSKFGRALLIVCALIATPLPARAGSFSDMFVFGDSLSDTGNVFIATGGLVPDPGQPYANGRFSNGPVWVEALVAGLGVGADAVLPSLVGGHNYAFGGARTSGVAPVPGILSQLAALWAPVAADPDALYVVVAGANDLRDARSAFPSASPADQAGRQAAAQAVANNLTAALGFLASVGAHHVLLANSIDLGATPEAFALGLAAASTAVSNAFNALVPDLLAAGAGFGLQMYLADFAGVFAAVRDDALHNGGAIYGITNVATPCGGFVGSSGASCDVSLYSDVLHPSAAAHALMAEAALDAVGAVPTVPEPSVVAMGLMAAMGVGMRRRSTRGGR